MTHRIGVLLACTAVSLSAFANPRSTIADSFIVDTLVDENNGIGIGGTSLREAILASNANASTADDTITFSVSGTILLTSDLPNITSNLTINGPGASALT